MTALLEPAASAILFFVVLGGLGLPLVAGLPLRAAEKLCLAPGAALIVIYLFAFGLFVLGAPIVGFLLLPVAALVAAAWRRRAIRRLFGDADVRSLLRAYGIWTGWTLGFLALVRCYFGVGAGATGDWVEHYQRTLFFLDHWPLDYRFIWLYPLPARPPLANLVTGAFLALGHENFASFQVISLLEATLVFLPGWLLGQRFRSGRESSRTFLLLCMLNPLLLHNTTYPWTKLITAYFVLAGLHLFLEGRERARGGYFIACFLFLSAGLLAHYSAGPYGLVLGVAYLAIHHRQWFRRAFVTTTGGLALVSVLLLATWFGWSWRHYGLRATVASNTSVTATDVASWRGLAGQKLGNLVSSLVPLPLRAPGHAPTELFSAAATFDQYGYLVYQLTLPFAFGITGGVFLLWLLGGTLGRPSSRETVHRRFWIGFLPAVILVGIAVNGGYDPYGVAHICLQPLVVLGIAFLGAHVPRLPGRLRRIFWTGATLDFAIGAALHFAVEHAGASLFLAGGPTFPGGLASLHAVPAGWTVPWLSNLLMKFYFGLSFIGDHGPPVWWLIPFLGCLLVFALYQRPPAAPESSTPDGPAT